MDPLVILSPHLDDAVLSCGQLMAGRPDVTVVTAFTGTPRRHRMLTTYDKDCGFRSAEEAMTVRRREDHQAMRDLHAAPSVYLDLLDNQYDPAKDQDDTMAAIVEAVAEVIEELRPETVIGPMGLAHPDHLICAGALRWLAEDRSHMDWWVYEDLPSRVLYPEQVTDQLGAWRSLYPHMALDFLGTGERDVKQRAVARYRSQLWALDPPTYLVPERHWRLMPCFV